MGDDAYRRLEMYQLARSLAVQVQAVTLKLATDAFGPQEIELRRSARATVRDVVAAYAHRTEQTSRLHHLRQARAWCEQTLASLSGLHASEALKGEEYNYLSSSYKRLDRIILKAIETEIDSPDSPFLIRERSREYETQPMAGNALISPLEGKVVLVTRAEEQAQAFIDLLDREGAYGIGMPMIEIAPPDSWEECDKAIINMRKYDGIIFTSVNAVRTFLGRVENVNREVFSILKKKNIYAVGEKTKSSLQQAGISVAFIPESFSAESLANALNEQDVAGKTFLIPKGDGGKDTLASLLRGNNTVVDEVIVYKNVKPDGVKATHLQQLLTNREVDVVTFFSPSSISHFVELVAPDVLGNVPVAVIGPTTARAAKELGLDVQIIAKESTSESLVETLKEYYS